MLRLLARYRITATFSMIGIEVQAYPAVAREVATAGHLIANHTWTHLNLLPGHAPETKDRYAPSGRSPGRNGPAGWRLCRPRR